jgi:hypothetical protein
MLIGAPRHHLLRHPATKHVKCAIRSAFGTQSARTAATERKQGETGQ